jgi:2-oxo-4-hydroxy-4-carboxy--5-ureidoimidazoline (OHCU) decarboxylase
VSDGPVLLAPTQLGGLDATALAAALVPLWEDAGPLVARLVGRSFSSWEEATEAAEAAITMMAEEEKIALLRGHPRIGEDPDRLAVISPISLKEQGGHSANAATLATLGDLNQRYEARFGFPFVEWVAGRRPDTMVEVLEGRLERARPVELDAGCAALVAIARDRLSRASVKAS